MQFMQKSPNASIWTIIAPMAVKSLSTQTTQSKTKNHIWAHFTLFMHKKPKCFHFNYNCTYAYIKPYLHKLGIMTPKATFDRNPCYLCWKAQSHPVELLLHIGLLNHFIHKLRIIKPKITFEPISRYLCTKSPNASIWSINAHLAIINHLSTNEA